MRSSGAKIMSVEVGGVRMHSVSWKSGVVTLTAVTDLESAKMHSFFLAIQHEQGCCRSHLHLARAQGAHDFRLDLGDLIFLFRVYCEHWSGKWFDNVRFATYSQVLCEEVSPGELKTTPLIESVSTGE